MPTTSNFGWTTPADTDLVKDGAAAIRTLGNGIDTSFLDLKGGTTGQVLSKASNTDLDFSWVAADDVDAIQKSLIDAEGDLIVGDAADAVQRLAIGSNGNVLTVDTTVDGKIKWAAPGGASFNTGVGYTATSQGTTSTSYTDLTTVTSTTVTTGTKALVSIVCRTANNSAVSGIIASFAVSGATTLAADDKYGVGMVFFDSSLNMQIQSGSSFVVTGLTAGSNTFTMKFKRPDGSGTVNFSQRTISVVDLGS